MDDEEDDEEESLAITSRARCLNKRRRVWLLQLVGMTTTFMVSFLFVCDCGFIKRDDRLIRCDAMFSEDEIMRVKGEREK